jgi:hypothetical protein
MRLLKRTEDRKLKMHTTKIIKSLTLAASLAAGIVIVTASQDTFAACDPRDHRTVCDPNIHQRPSWTAQPVQNPNIIKVTPTVTQNGQLTNWNNGHTVYGVRNDGTTVGTRVSANNKIYSRVNRDGSVDRVQALRQADGTWKEQGVIHHTPPRSSNHVDLGSCGILGC